MLIAGLVVFLFIVGLFLQAVTSGPKAEPEQPLDTDGELASTPSHGEEDAVVVIG
jgi:hypothetical protein